jgi:glycosyltransferase involved in cell wall biosynthesis
MRVIILGTRGFPNVQGGVEKHCECLSINLVALGCKVIVFTRKPYVDKSLKQFNGVKLIPIPATKNRYLENILHTLLGICISRLYKHDILHIQSVGSALFTPLARLLGNKVILTSHGSNYRHIKWGRFAKLVLRFSEFMGIAFANKVIAITPTIGEEIKKKYRRKVAVIPNGVETPKITDSNYTIRKHRLEGKKYVLSVGRFVREKGFHTLIDAFKLAGLDGVMLVIVGQADHEDAYSLQLKQSASENRNIIMTGVLSGIALNEIYTNADLFVLPSFYEGLPISLLEATSYGLSCIASDIPGNRSVGLDGDRYFEAGNTVELADKIVKYSGNPLTASERDRQVSVITKNYDWKNIAVRTLEVYQNSLGN